MVTALRVFSLGLATFRLKFEASVSARAMLTAVPSTLEDLSVDGNHIISARNPEIKHMRSAADIAGGLPSGRR